MRLLIVDDDALVRAGLAAILSAEPDMDVCGEAADGVEVPDLVARLRPDVVLMDVRMPVVDGLTATRALLARPDPPRVLVLTTFAHDGPDGGHVQDALRAGAAGFLLKRARPAEIVHAVRVVAAGESVLVPAAARDVVARPGGDRLAAAGLTPREAEVLDLMARGRSNREIAAALHLGVETVKTHVGSVLGKLGVRDRTQAVVRAYESGFVDPRRR